MKWYNAFDFLPADPGHYLVAVRQQNSLGLSEYVTQAYHDDEAAEFSWMELDIKRTSNKDFYVLAWAEMPEFPKFLEESDD